MTMLPSAILVNELHIKPVLQKLFCPKQRTSSHDDMVADTGIVVSEAQQTIHQDATVADSKSESDDADNKSKSNDANNKNGSNDDS